MVEKAPPIIGRSRGRRPPQKSAGHAVNAQINAFGVS
jgi:hypothetical protein